MHFLSQKKKINIIALSETYLNDINCNDFDDLPGYHPLSLCEKHRSDRKGGGVALFIDNTFKFVVREDLSYFSTQLELIVAEINPATKDSFFVCSLYRPPGVSVAELDAFKEFVNKFVLKVNHSRVKACYILGDININLLQYGCQSSYGLFVSEFIDSLFADNHVPLILRPTRIDTNSNSYTLIDNIFTNRVDTAAASFILKSDLSDHFISLYSFEKGTSKRTSPVSKRTTRKFNSSNCQAFRGLLSTAKWSQVFESEGPDQKLTAFNEIWDSAFDFSFPPVQINTANRHTVRSPWMTSGLLKSCYNKQKYYVNRNKSPTKLAFYKKYNNLFNKLKRIAKTTYYHNKLNYLKGNARETWRVLNSMTKHSVPNSSLHCVSSIIMNNKLITDAKDIAEALNNHFCSIGESTCQAVPKSNKESSFYVNSATSPSNF